MTTKKKTTTSTPKASKKKATRTVVEERASNTAASDDVATTTAIAEPTRDEVRASMQDLGIVYVGHLKAAGKSDKTIASYRFDFMHAIEELGAATKLDALTPERVLEYFTCDRVMKLRSGKPKSQLSIDKTRRVLRQALEWAVEAKLIEKAPLPEAVAAY